MTGYTPTHLGIPKNHADFERKSLVLFQSVLRDPSVKRLGRSGQRQYGIDLLGYRSGKLKALVGIQCKKKQPNKKLTAAEVRSEVRKALKYKPLLSEYIIITTAPDDTALDKLATALTKQQLDKKRKIKIQVWGWDTLEDHIDRNPAAKEAFDPGASPAVKEVTRKLSRIEQGQATQATAEQVASLVATLEHRVSADDDRLPPKFADTELSAEISRINRRRGFAEANTVEEWVHAAQRILHGDLERASPNLQADALESAARASTLPESVDRAKLLHAEALKRNPQLNVDMYDALLPAAEGNSDKTLRALRGLRTPQARSAMLVVLIRIENAPKALEWIKSSNFGISDLDSGGALNLLLQRIEVGEYDQALHEAEMLSEVYIKERPASRMIRSGLLLSSALPKDQRRVPFQGIAINPRMLRFNSLDATSTILVKAREELEKLLAETADLQLTKLRPLVEEQILWLKLECEATRQVARRQIEQEIKDPQYTLRRVRLALAYDIPFNREALKRTLEASRQFGRWTNEEQFAAFLLAWFNESLSELADFFDSYREDIYSQKLFDLGMLLGIEVEALLRVHRFDDARARIAEGRGTLVDGEVADQMEELVASTEQGDEIERLRKLYEKTKEFTYLRLLVAALVAKRDHRQLATYAPMLLAETQHVDEYELAQKALFSDHQYHQVVALAKEYPSLHKLDDDFLALEGWAYFYLGQIMQARAIARNLVGRRDNSGDRELDINTTVESGDWGYLQAVVAREAGRVEKLEAKLLMRLARIAFESGSLYVDKFRDAAIEREPNNPEILLAAYQLSVERGDEYQETRAHEWFQQAINLSGENGPVQSVDLKEVVARTSGWHKRVDDVDAMLSEVKIPLFMAARGLNRQPLDFILGTAIRNSKSTHANEQFPIVAFSGSRPLFDLTGVRKLALDITSIFTLEFLGILQKAIDAFDQIIISPATFSSLFADRQFIRFRQPSEVTKAREIKKMLADRRLKVLKTFKTDAEVAASEIDPDIQALLDSARAANGVVVRSAPVYSRGSFLEEEADLTPFADVLTDTHAALTITKARISASVAKSAAAYLSQVDRGWQKRATITKKSKVYLDQLTVTYLYHVGLLEAFIASVAEVYVPQEVEDRCNAILLSDEFSSDLLNSLERIRAIFHGGLERGNVVFSARRLRSGEETVEVEDELAFTFPTLDLLFDLSEIDAVVVDDRFLNKEAAWNDGNCQVPSVSTIEVLIALNSRGILSEAQKYALLNRLREGGYYTVPTDASELMSELNRSTVDGGRLVESKELATIRGSLTIGLRSRMHSSLEAPWVDYTRAVIVQALRNLWSEKSPLTSIVPRADWLLAALPLQTQLVKDPADEAQWQMAIQRTGAMIGMILAPPMVTRERQREYSNWIEERLISKTRADQRIIYDRAILTLSEFFQRMLEPDAALPLNLRKAAMAELAASLHPNVERDLIDKGNVAAAIGLKVTPIVVFNGTHHLVVESFVAALRLAVRGKRSAKITMNDSTTRDVRLKFIAPGTATIAFADASFTFTEADLLLDEAANRKRALKRIFSKSPLASAEEDEWFHRVKKRSLNAKEFSDFLEQLRFTPEYTIGALAVPQSLDAKKLIPQELSYYNRLVGPVQGDKGFADYLQQDRREYSSFILSRKIVGVRRLAYGAISRPMIPFDQLDTVPLDQIAELLIAEDPFSLVFGFEVCQHRLSKGEKKAAALGTKFLKRLLSNREWLQSRLELFSACAVLGMVALRPAANDPVVPLSWFRLAVLSHAGVLTTALRGIKKPADFYEWSAKEFGAAYLWNTVVDTIEEPRWESGWIGPEALKAELIGRCFNALALIEPKKQPKAWRELIDSALRGLDTKLRVVFPGPLDNFLPLSTPIQAEGALDEVRSLLRRRSSFKRAPGIIFLAYAGGIDARLKDEIFRLLESSNEQLAKFATADRVLRDCAYISAITRDTELANAVVARCLRLISRAMQPDAVLKLFLTSMHACGANSDRTAYYREVAAIATRFAYAVSDHAALELRKVFETMKSRDLRLAASLGRAEAVLEASLLEA